MRTYEVLQKFTGEFLMLISFQDKKIEKQMFKQLRKNKQIDVILVPDECDSLDDFLDA